MVCPFLLARNDHLHLVVLTFGVGATSIWRCTAVLLNFLPVASVPVVVTMRRVATKDKKLFITLVTLSGACWRITLRMRTAIR